MMNRRTSMIWQSSLHFLHVYRKLRFLGVSLAPLLLRDFQKYASLHLAAFQRAGLTRKHANLSNIQRACTPYFPVSRPNYARPGYTLVKADLYAVTEGISKEKFVYLAHHRHEYERMRKTKACRPLLLLDQLKPVKCSTHKVWKQFKHIVSSAKTPAPLRSQPFQRWMKIRLRKAMLRLRKMQTLFKRYAIKRTIYGSTLNRHGSLVTTYAQTRRIPTLNVQHGIFGPLGHLPVNADLNFVWGRSHAEYLQSFGAKPANLIVNGPLFFRSCKLRHRQAAHEASLSSADSPLRVLVALQPLGRTYNRTLIRIIEQAARSTSSHIQLQYKLHPDHGAGRPYRRYVQRRQSRLVPHGHIPLESLIDACDLVITPYSSVAFEGMIQQKPVLFYRKPPPLYYLEQSPIYFRESAALQSWLAAALKDKSALQAIQERNKPKDALPDQADYKLRMWETIHAQS
ncbi:CDP-glycerol glycerophosphotransferase family protein [Marinicrinis sediminis]|uniref:CDP-glycerol glycerophosphotransferase family protein n=1 Tax=Marinicrinis sediminis TaxID=1652465 RepID=A0ABW5R719_9BACL